MNHYSEIKGRDHLVIAIGDSWTHGWGCYEPELLAKYGWSNPPHIDLTVQSYKRFFKSSWVTHLASKLNIDFVNFGKGGDSNTTTAKRLINEIDLSPFSIAKYKRVTVIWMLSSIYRLGLYSKGGLHSFLVDFNKDKFTTTYFTEIAGDNDLRLETSFAIKAVKNYCKANDFEFIYGSAFTSIHDIDAVVDFPDDNIHHKIDQSIVSLQNILPWHDPTMWAPDKHPNEKGYEVIGRFMSEALHTHYGFMRI